MTNYNNILKFPEKHKLLRKLLANCDFKWIKISKPLQKVKTHYVLSETTSVTKPQGLRNLLFFEGLKTHF